MLTVSDDKTLDTGWQRLCNGEGTFGRLSKEATYRRCKRGSMVSLKAVGRRIMRRFAQFQITGGLFKTMTSMICQRTLLQVYILYLVVVVH
ncbi:hypothetical protein QFC19_004734 [Naganishia cerealis]|uniref:Uncharacterized protein n=1 Tax=Naganishia cerealis TaxID=610337 RepID=A0ACC2VT81_9TREE|nr:hypothetical protein QFC19_004734 [Naganishia cerealis]